MSFDYAYNGKKSDRSIIQTKIDKLVLVLETILQIPSNGQRGFGLMFKSDVNPALKRSIPAQAIIAALSVQSAMGGATNVRPLLVASSSSRVLKYAFAATPPATTRC